ncbi:hypothetical protein EHP00_388 [Ecytonucleospora hepatopenaei]|uniref:Brix domain-containing protein n=1 Tax=Ecytonucleospora hepatopenaei TaxID=646526 RepID=A0A1W0E9E6_9MICR|nr:hypothetical protein EHP00_388 [Ecytonucleospora hepatopenaei]
MRKRTEYRTKKEIKELKKKQKEEEYGANKSDWKYKMIFTTKKPSKKLKNLCKQLRTILRPEALFDNENDFIKESELDKFTTQMNVSHYFFVKQEQKDIFINFFDKKHSKSFLYKVIEYTDNFKVYPNEIYKEKPLVSFKGLEGEEKISFESLFYGSNTKKFRRILLITREKQILYIRHYLYKVANDISNYIISLNEIGPRLTLELQ